MAGQTTAKAAFDPLDMNNYKVEKLPKMQKSKFEVWMARLGGPLAVIAFVWICWFCHIGFLDNLDQSTLAASAQKRLGALGLDGFIRANYAMLGIFVASLILWMTEALPNYLTSLLLILGVVLCGVTTQKEALAQLGHPVMWLNILSFVLASMLVKTQFAKRLALAFVIRFGKSAKGVLWSFLVINLVLSAFISATTVKATIMLPIFMVICAIYGASDGHRNNFGRNLVIQNLFQVNIGANAFYTGSGARGGRAGGDVRLLPHEKGGTEAPDRGWNRAPAGGTGCDGKDERAGMEGRDHLLHSPLPMGHQRDLP